MELQFDEKMFTNFNLSHLNTSNMDIWLAPANDWHLEDEMFVPGSLNFTWNVTRFNQTEMDVQINFDNPSEISPNLTKYDQIVVEFLTHDVVVDLKNNTLDNTCKTFLRYCLPPPTTHHHPPPPTTTYHHHHLSPPTTTYHHQ